MPSLRTTFSCVSPISIGLRRQPEIILDLSFAGRNNTTEWSAVDVPAVKQGRVIALAHPYLLAPSPRVKEALAALAGALR